jgi:ABC-type phosphate transport system substrate-binding protein
LRIIRRLVAVGAMAATAAALVAAPALADPPGSHKHVVVPKAYDIVSVGSESIAAISDQLSFNYNLTVKHHSAAHPFYYSWDGVPAGQPNNTGQHVTLKAGCRNVRPNGSTAGIKALASYGNAKGTTFPCVDFARSSRPFSASSNDPPFAPGGVAFDTLWSDAVTYATTSNTNAPNNLTRAQLAEIFNCSVPAANSDNPNTWGALLGSKAKPGTANTAIDPIVPQQGSGTLSFWMKTALGLTSTTEPTCGTAAGLTVNQQPEENEGISTVFLSGGKPNPNVIYPFSIGAWLAQKYHSAKCGKKPSKSQNKFGCAVDGVFHLNGISGVAPFVNGRGKHAAPVTNKKFPRAFDRFLYAVVPYFTGTTDHIAPKLEKLLGHGGYFCSRKQASVVAAYGFESTRFCGFTT